MKITVVAATGRVGRLIVDQALAAGHDVTAVARHPAGVDPRVSAHPADLAIAGVSDLEPALAGADAVISALGPRTRADAGIVSAGTPVLVAAMRSVAVTRLVMISAAPVGGFRTAAHPERTNPAPGDDVLTGRVLYPLIQRVFRGVYADLSAAEDTVIASDLDWTIVRPPQLTDGPRTGRYRSATSANLPRGRRISRADTAAAMVAAASDPAMIRQILRVAY